MSDFKRIIADLNSAGVRYVLVGGIALIRHGVVRFWTKLGAAGRRSAYWWYVQGVTWRSSAVSRDASRRAKSF